ARFAAERDLPGVAVSDAHSVLEVGVAYTALDGDPSTPDGLLTALPSAELVAGRASYAVRLWTPVAKGVQRLRGKGRVRPPTAP
ncbi:MAG: PHP-associated domain-containing protein, partial [Candidatus Limnocylindria bacterium]